MQNQISGKIEAAGSGQIPEVLEDVRGRPRMCIEHTGPHGIQELFQKSGQLCRESTCRSLL